MINGAFLKDNCYILAKEKIARISSLPIDKSISMDLLNLHTSTKERLPFICNFYDSIFDVTGIPNSIIDIGCGFNPFSLSLWDFSIKKYYAYDLDNRNIELINEYFKVLNLPQLAEARDVITFSPSEKVDITFLFKLLPVIKSQDKNRCKLLLESINSKYIVISYPLKSIGGKSKGMKNNYSHLFESEFNELFLIQEKLVFTNELVYIVMKRGAL